MYKYIYVEIDISEFFDPLSNNSEIKCISYSMNSCAKDNLVPDTQVYISIYCSYNCSFEMILILAKALPLNLSLTYNIQLISSPTILLSFTLDQIYYELLIGINLNFFNYDLFYVYLAKDYIPSSSKFDKQGVYFGNFKKILKLDQHQLQLNSTYYILIQAKILQIFQVQFRPMQQTVANSLSINHWILDLTSINRTYHAKFNLNDSTDLFIKCNNNFGRGRMIFQYCLDDPFYYENLLGHVFVLIITKQQRDQCRLKLLKQNITQNLTITIIPYINSYGYAIQIQEGKNASAVTLHEKYFCLIMPSTINNYYFDIPLRQDINISLLIQIYKGDPKFQLRTCFNNLPCNLILSDQLYTIYAFNPKNCLKNCFLKLTVLNSTLQSTYSFLFKPYAFHYRLIQNLQKRGFVLLNQFFYYNLTLLSSVNISSVIIKLTPMDGDMSMLASRVLECPNFKDLFIEKSDVKSSWNGIITYYQNLSKPIYISIFGQVSGFYNIIVYTKKKQDEDIYQLLIQNINNQYVINKDPLLLKYVPHNIPYQIKFFTSPACISYGAMLPLKKICMPLPQKFYEPIFINITGNRIGSVMTIFINNDNYQLSAHKPIFITCNNHCYEIININIDKETKVIHSGSGKIINNETKQQTSNGILVINCKSPENQCKIVIMAQLNSAGNMFVNVQNNNLSGISWLPKSVTLNNLPRQFYYRLPKNGPSVITVDSKGAVIDIYANIQIINQNYTNLLQLIYPTNQSYDLRQIGDPFRRIYMLQIEKQFLSTLGCFNDQTICIATISIYLNQKYQYSKQFINNGIIYISAASSNIKLLQNTPYRINSANQIQYFQYVSNQPKNLTLLLQPISNCNPPILYLNQTNHYPTLDYYTSLSYQKMIITNVVDMIVGVVIQDQCLFDIIILPSTNNYRSMIAGFPQKIELAPYQTQYILYTSKNELSIEIDSVIDVQIYANIIPYKKDTDSYLPNRTSSEFSTKIPPLIIQKNNSANYIIAIINPYNKTIQTNILIKQQNQVIMLIHNMLYSSECNEIKPDQYVYTTANTFKIYFTRQGGNFHITVSNSNNHKQIFDLDSDSQIIIQNNGISTQFSISVQGFQISKYTLQIIEIADSRRNLFQGLPFSDMFTSYPQSNYYTITGHPISNRPLSVSFIYSSSSIHSLPNNKHNTSILKPIFSFEFTGIDKKQKTPKLLKIHEFYQGITYQIEQQYGIYIFCFQNQNKENIYKQYSIILSSDQITYLISSIPLFVSSPSNQMLQKYQTFTTEPSTLIIELYTCQGKAQLTGATKYSDILTGYTSEIMNHYMNQYYYSGIINISKGYYYIGVQSLISQTSYILNSYLYVQSSQIPLYNWELEEINLKWYVKQSDMIVTVVPLKTLDSQYQSQIPHIYTLYISNNSASLKLRYKCQILDEKNHFIIIKQNQKLSIASLVAFKIPLISLPYNFSMTCKVEVNTSYQYIPRMIPYYYNVTQQIITQDLFNNKVSSESNIYYIIIIIVSCLIILLILGYVIYKYKNKWLSSEITVPFEMGELNLNKKKQMKAEMHQPAYGEFVDQSRF